MLITAFTIMSNKSSPYMLALVFKFMKYTPTFSHGSYTRAISSKFMLVYTQNDGDKLINLQFPIKITEVNSKSYILIVINIARR